jgi:HlyD family type I secretion membrane fusion protein
MKNYLVKGYRLLKSSVVKFIHSSFFKTMQIVASPKTAHKLGYKTDHEQELRSMIKPAVKAAFMVIGVGVGFFLIWGGLAPLDKASIAKGSIIVSGNHKTIQHLEGGVIEQINVKEGQQVNEGDVLVKLNDTSDRARVQVEKSRLNFALAIDARLLAEQDKMEHIYWDPNIFDLSNPEVQQIIKTQNHLFETGKQAYKGKISTHEEQIGSYQEQIIGSQAQLASYESQLRTLGEELESIEALYKKGLALKTRVNELRRSYDDVDGRRAQMKASILSARQEIAARNSEILNVENEYQQKIAAEMKENHSQLLEHNEQYNAYLEILQRKVIRAPSSGVVADLQIHTIGGVISPGAKIMDLVPEDQKLIIEAEVNTQDIESIHVGMIAKISVDAYKSRLVPRLNGKVIYVSADKTSDPKNPQAPPHYVARIEIDDSELDNLVADVRLYPGMPVSVFIVKGTRTFLQYLLSPITDSFYKAFKET